MSDKIDYEKAFFQHVDQINTLESEVERLQMLDTQGLSSLQEENLVRSIAIEGQRKEIERLAFQLNAWRTLADIAVESAANLSALVGIELIRARTRFGCQYPTE